MNIKFVMDKRLIFDKNFQDYDQIRPDYPTELYKDIFRYMNNRENIKALEIGIGAGQATKPFLQKGYDITAVEIGENFVSLLRDKFYGYSSLNVICGDFMEENLSENYYDLIYSATAFHWLPDQKYRKAMSLLKTGGIIPLFWNRPFVRNLNDLSNLKIAKVYDRYFGKSDKAKPFSEENILKMCSELIKNGFKFVECKLYNRVRTLTSDEYITLLNTYSDHCSLPGNIKISFENDILSALGECDNKINIYDTIDLYLGKKC